MQNVIIFYFKLVRIISYQDTMSIKTALKPVLEDGRISLLLESKMELEVSLKGENNEGLIVTLIKQTAEISMLSAFFIPLN